MSNKVGSEPIYAMVTERTLIAMRDGVSVAVTLYRPGGAALGERFPVLFEFLPYRKDDGTVNRDRPRYEYFARRGYVGARVDVRGTGASEGVADDQYSEQEGRDALEVIAWLAAQPWSNGNVGMWGISYGGFNAIQTAMLRPPALKAILAVDATDDVYTDDILYWNGALQFEALGRWPFSMVAPNGTPGYPDYDVHGEAARARFENEPWILEWLRRQRDSAYWRRVSLRPRYDAIEIPTLMFSGWLDGYTDSVPRMMARMRAPTRAIIGPWPHAWPDQSRPGPAIDGQREALRWWDHWLKGIDTGLMQEPALAVFVQRWYPPRVGTENIPGEWRTEDGWPVARVQESVLRPQADGTLGPNIGAGFEHSLEYKATVGSSNRYRVPHNPAELFSDQRADDAWSLSYTSAPLTNEIEILGFPRAVLHVSATAPVATWIVRLSDVAPDGSSMLVSKGILPGTHRTSHSEPQPMAPGEAYELQIEMKFNSWVFSLGHRIRLSVCNADFPNLWPSPYRMTTRLYGSPVRPSRVVLPVCPSVARPQPGFRPPELDQTGAGGSAPINQWQITRDEMQQTITMFRETTMPEYSVPSDGIPISMAYFERRWCTASDVEPAKASLRAEGGRRVKRGADEIVVNSWLLIRSDETEFDVTVKRELSLNGTVIRSKEWQEKIPRDHI